MPSGLLVALSAVWMARYYDGVNGPVLYGLRVVFSTMMVVSILIGFTAILKRNVPKHLAFMIRAYAIAQGAGAQSVVFLPLFLAGFQPEGVLRELLMGATWVFNLTVAEWIIRRRPMLQVLKPAAI